jgi:hypothetical protein
MKGVTLHANCEYPSPTASERLIDEKIFWEKCEASKLDASFFLSKAAQPKWSFSHVRKYRLAYACCPVVDDECDQ